MAVKPVSYGSKASMLAAVEPQDAAGGCTQHKHNFASTTQMGGMSERKARAWLRWVVERSVWMAPRGLILLLLAQIDVPLTSTGTN
jgi:hypothetical protein